MDTAGAVRASDFIKPTYGGFKLIKVGKRQDFQPTNPKMLEESDDMATAIYQVSGHGVWMVVLHYSDPAKAEFWRAAAEAETRNAGWRVVPFPNQTDNAFEATDPKQEGIVGWSSGRWLFLLTGPGEYTKSLAHLIQE